MNSAALLPAQRRPLRRVLVLADESAGWKVAGLRQIDRIALTLQECAAGSDGDRIDLCVSSKSQTILPNDSLLENLTVSDNLDEFLAREDQIDLVISTRLFLYRGCVPQLLAATKPSSAHDLRAAEINALALRSNESSPWQLLHSKADIPACERKFLRHNGKSQDGLVSRYLNRRVSRWLSRWLLKLPISPTLWSMMIFVLPIIASFAFLRGSYLGFVVAAAIFQLYSIVDGCDGEIARAKFMQSEFGRRFDSLCDLVGNLLLALTLGFGLERQANTLTSSPWLYAAEGIATAMLIVTSEGIVFARRSRVEIAAPTGRWQGLLYQRHHEFLERSGILVLGERFAWWLVQLTKRDMAMLAFLLLALCGLSAWNLHLLLVVSAISSALAGKAFLRPAVPALAQEAS